MHPPSRAAACVINYFFFLFVPTPIGGGAGVVRCKGTWVDAELQAVPYTLRVFPPTPDKGREPRTERREGEGFLTNENRHTRARKYQFSRRKSSECSTQPTRKNNTSQQRAYYTHADIATNRPDVAFFLHQPIRPPSSPDYRKFVCDQVAEADELNWSNQERGRRLPPRRPP